MQPVLQLLIVVQFGERTFNQCTFALIDVTVSLGRGHHGLEDCLAVLLDLHGGHAVDGLRLTR
ncbi:hypothetical protein D3C78_1866930 [compost metagenome]